jgi:L-ascorbate metabolism protein UlaG (beta-lactamase superfamily)
MVTDVDIDHIKADYLFITHGHGDHTADLMKVAKNTGAQCVASAEIASWLNKNGITKVHPVKIVGVHYNTWPIIGIDADKAKADFAAAGKELILPKPGETIEL